MKKLLFVSIAALCLLAGCAGNKTRNLDKCAEAIDNEIAALSSDTTLTEADYMAKIGEIFKREYALHKSDSLGLELFITLITNFTTPQEALSLYDEAEEMVRNNVAVKAKIEAIGYQASVAPGKPYKEIEGVDAVSGKPLSLSSLLASDKPTIVDFWASWCVPCRNEIKAHLLGLAAEGKVNIVGVAVWEKRVEDTQKAMSELGISWPVIYSGGRENSPSVQYGVMGIPTLFLISPDGTILSSGHSVTDLGL